MKRLCGCKRLTTGLIYEYAEAYHRGAEGLSADPPVKGGKGPSLSRYRALLEEEDREIH